LSSMFRGLSDIGLKSLDILYLKNELLKVWTLDTYPPYFLLYP
jgi:hypothetical protein